MKLHTILWCNVSTQKCIIKWIEWWFGFKCVHFPFNGIILPVSVAGACYMHKYNKCKVQVEYPFRNPKITGKGNPFTNKLILHGLPNVVCVLTVLRAIEKPNKWMNGRFMIVFYAKCFEHISIHLLLLL